MDAVKEIVSTLVGLLLVAGAFFWLAGRAGNNHLDH